MSHTYTNRPSVSRTGTRGRGRGRGRGTGTRPMEPNTNTNGASPDPRARGRGRGRGSADREYSQEGETLQDRMARRDAYTVIAPNQEKRNAIAQQAQKETENYEKFKASKKLGHVSYHGTVGGGEMSESAARNKFQQAQKRTSFDQRTHYGRDRDEQRRKEDQAIAAKKAEARRKSEQNKAREAERQANLQQEHRMKNEAFLAKLEQGSKKTPKKQASRPEESSTGSPPNGATAEHCHGFNMSKTHSSSVEGHGWARTPLEVLQGHFPSYDPAYLEGILAQMHGDVEMVKELLS